MRTISRWSPIGVVEALVMARPEQEIVVTLAKQVGIIHLAFLAGKFMTFMQRK